MAKITSAQMTYLSYFEYNIYGETFIKKYIKFAPKSMSKERAISMANHLWSKFKLYNHSIVKLFGNLDKENQRIVIKIINSGYK